jgi:hypothetical protein
MNVDEAMEAAADWFKVDPIIFFAETVAVVLAAEVERLRAELELSKANVQSLKKALFEVQEAAIRLGDRLDDTETELATAKAASVLPVEIESVYVNKYLGSVVVFIGHEKGAVEFDAWLCDRVKERGER